MQTRTLARALPVALLTALCAAPAAAQTFADTDDEIDSMIEEARRDRKNHLDLYYAAQSDSELDFDNAVEIEARTIDLPYGQMKLAGGLLVPVAPKEIKPEDVRPGVEVPERKPIAAVYLGSGTFRWEAPHPSEAWLLKYNLEELGVKDAPRDALELNIAGSSVLFFNGRFRDVLFEGGKKAAADSKQEKAATKSWNARADLHLSNVARADTADSVAGSERDLFMAEVETDTHKRIPWLTYQHDPGDFESTTIGVIKRNPLNRDSLDQWDLGQWFRPEDAAARSPAENSYLACEHDFDITHYDLDITFFRDSDYGEWGMRVEGRADYTARKPMRSVTLGLMTRGNGRPVKVKHVRDAEGNELAFLHRSGELIIDFGRELPLGESSSIEFSYEGLTVDTVKQPPPTTGEDKAYVAIISYIVPDNSPWYPQNEGFSDRFTFDWTLRTPKPLIAASSGTLVSFTDEGKFNVHTIKQDTDVTFPAIVFGNFTVRENDPDYAAGEKKIRVYAFPGFDKDAQSFIDEAAGIIAYFESLFGPYPWPELDLIQMRIGASHAQAPSGIVRMDGAAYISKTDLINLFQVSEPNLRDYYIPHELGHHWWGAIAGHGHYRDQWFSETMAEYAAALYIEYRDAQKAGDPNNTDGYDTRSEGWSLNRKGHVARRTSPLWLGYRGGTWQSTAYARGPLIMDMLRRNLGKEAVVKAMYLLLTYTKEKREGITLSDDFRKVLEQTVPGVAFDEFMNAYVYGNAVIEGWESKNKKTRD